MVGRIRTCNAPRFKRELYVIGATTTRVGEAGVESGYAQGYVVRQALGLFARALMGGAGIESRYAQSYDQRGARPTELPARVKLRDKDSNLDLHVQSVTSSH